MVDHSGHGCEQVAGKETKRGERPIVLNRDRKSTRLNSSHSQISYAVFCLKKKKIHYRDAELPQPGRVSPGSCAPASGELPATVPPIPLAIGLDAASRLTRSSVAHALLSSP